MSSVMTSRRLRCRMGIVPFVAVSTIALLAHAGPAVSEDVAAHPKDLQFGELQFEVPDATALRHELASGQIAYVVEDHALPLVNVVAYTRLGGYLDPADQVGLASLTASMMRRGGAGELSPDDFEERVDFLAAQLGASAGDTSASASVNCVRSALSECLDLFFSMLERPRFEQSQLRLEKQNLLEDFKQRNDDPAALASREWQWLLSGNEHPSTWSMTDSDLEAIDRAALVEFHRAYWRPDRLVFAISGDVETPSFLEDLSRRMQAWQASGPAADVPWPPPEIQHVPSAGVYYVEKDIPQGRVYLGLPTKKLEDWQDPDYFPTLLMNEILGGGGFTSRITKRIRSDEGLAYSAGSSFSMPSVWRGRFHVAYQSKSETVAFAAAIALEEIDRIRNELVTEQELATAKAAYADTFPANFDSAASTAAIYATDQLLGRPHEYWQQYRDRVQAVTREQVQAAAREYLVPERMSMLVVGDWSEIEAGDPQGRATMQQIRQRLGGQAARQLPQRDPVTLEPVQ